MDAVYSKGEVITVNVTPEVVDTRAQISVVSNAENTVVVRYTICWVKYVCVSQTTLGNSVSKLFIRQHLRRK